MNDPLPRPVESAPPRLDQSSETAQNLIEATGNPPAAASAARPTVASDRPTAPPSATVAPQRLGDYAVVRKIGEGGMGTVYLAEDTKLHRKAAIKTLKAAAATNPTDRDRFEREARAAAAVEHDNIVPIWQVGEAADGTPFIAMPFLQGEMLDARLKRDPVANLGLILKVAREVADGLAAAHAKGLIHRDIKPGNIWLEGDLSSKQLAEQVRRCKILDFGLARSVDVDDTQITASGAILGTPAYMSPEQARAEKADHRTDLFSLGVTLYRMATGQLPFRGATAMSTLIALATETPRSVRVLAPRLPAAVADLIERLMAKDPAARPQSAAAVSAAVRDIVKNLQAKQAGKAESGSRPVPVLVLPEAAPNPWEDVTEPETDEPLTKAPQPAKRSRAPWYLAAGVLSLFALVAVLGVIIVRVETAEGTLVVEVSDPDVEARVKNGKLVLVGPDGKEKYTISPADRDKKIDAGAYKIRVEGADGLSLDTSEFTLKKNGLVTVRVTLDPKLAKKPAPARPEATDFREVHGASEAELERWMRTQREDGLLPVYLSAEAGSAVRFNALAVPNLSKKAWRFFPRDEIESALWKRTWQEQTDAGFRHALCCLYHDNNRSFEWQVWALDGQPGGGWAGNREFIAEKLKECRTAKLRPVNFTAGVYRDAVRFQFLMGPGGGRDWDAQLGLTLEELSEFVTRQKRQGWRLEWLSPYREKDQLRFTALFVENPDAAEWDFQPGMTAKEYETLLQKKAERKLRPLAVASYTADGRTLYAAVWSESSSTETVGSCDRKAAEYVLSLGGTVRVNGENGDIKALNDLPRKDFRVTHVGLSGNKLVTDKGLAAFSGCRHVEHLLLSGTHVGDAGLAYFKDCIGLKALFLVETQIGNGGLANFKNCRDLIFLQLGGTHVTNDGLSIFKGVKTLKQVGLWGTAITEEGLTSFSDSKGLTFLTLERTKISDAGMRRVKEFASLKELYLIKTEISDAGLVHIRNLNNLTEADLRDTKVTEKGVADLVTALPQCRIQWKGGTIEPRVPNLDADRKAAEYVLSVGGRVGVNGTGENTGDVNGLPKEPFRLTYVDLHENKKLDEAGFAVFKGCKHITDINLENSSVPDAALKYLEGCTDLLSLNLAGTPVSDAGLAPFKACKKLTDLRLWMTKVGDDGISYIQGCNRLTSLGIGGTKVSDKGLAALASCINLTRIDLKGASIGDKGLIYLKDLNLTHLWLEGSQVTDAGLITFNQWKGLVHLSIEQTRVTDAGLAALEECKALMVLQAGHTTATALGIARFAKARPQCRIEWDGGTVEPATASDRSAAEWALAANGSVQVDGDANDIKAKADLPKGFFRLTGVLITTPVKDADLAVLKDCKNLAMAYLGGTKITNAGLEHLKGCANLTDLNLSGTGVDDGSVAIIKGFARLKDLSVGLTKIGDKGVKEIAAALPGCRIQYDGGTIEPKK